MYCVSCGAKLPENAAFCPACGNPVNTPPSSVPTPEAHHDLSECSVSVKNTPVLPAESAIFSEAHESPANRKRMCPKCDSENVKILNDSNTEGSLYGTGKGCLGYLLLGPLGLLCGACGSKIRTSSRVFWVCEDCGETFRRIQDIDEDIAKIQTSKKKSNKWLVILISILLLIYSYAFIVPTFIGESRSVPIPIYISFAVWVVIVLLVYFLARKSYNNTLKQLYEEKNSLHDV